jgi:hypothetical protein
MKGDAYVVPRRVEKVATEARLRREGHCMKDTVKATPSAFQLARQLTHVRGIGDVKLEDVRRVR